MGLIITDKSRHLMQSWRDDWNKFSRDVLKVRLSTWQEEGLNLIQHNKRTSFCTGTSFGKDFLGSVATWCFLLLTPDFDANGIFQNALVINTGPSAAQVNQIMLAELKARYVGSKLPALVKAGLWSFRLRNDGVVFDVPEQYKGDERFGNYAKWGVSCFKGDEYNQERWQGFHSENIMVVVTEASGIPPLVFNGVHGCLQNNSRLVLLHNANVASGEAYESLKNPQFISRRISAFQSDNYILGKKLNNGEITELEYNKQRFPGQVDYEWVKDHITKPGWTVRIDESEKNLSKNDFEFEGKWYRPSVVCGIKILAVHPKSNDDTLIPLDWIESAQERWLIHKRPSEKPIRGVDVAGMGVDTTVFCDRYGNYVDNLRTIATSDPNTALMQLCGILVNDQSKCLHILVDSIGIGAGVYSRLKEQGVNNVIGFKNSYSARNLTDKTQTRRFVNMRSYTHWEMRDWLDPQLNSNAMLPPDDELKAQLCEIRYNIKSDGFIIIEPKNDIKKRLGVSPDKSDTLAQTFAPIELMQGYDNSDTDSVSGSEIIF